MIKFLIASHGKLASGIQSSIHILLGNTSNIDVIDAYIDETNIKEKLDEKIRSVSEEDTLILLSDLQGGSVNQYMMEYLIRKNTYLITGINLALILELVVGCPNHVDRDILENYVNNARAMMNVVMLEDDIENEEFF